MARSGSEAEREKARARKPHGEPDAWAAVVTTVPGARRRLRSRWRSTLRDGVRIFGRSAGTFRRTDRRGVFAAGHSRADFGVPAAPSGRPAAGGAVIVGIEGGDFGNREPCDGGG